MTRQTKAPETEKTVRAKTSASGVATLPIENAIISGPGGHDADDDAHAWAACRLGRDQYAVGGVYSAARHR